MSGWREVARESHPSHSQSKALQRPEINTTLLDTEGAALGDRSLRGLRVSTGEGQQLPRLAPRPLCQAGAGRFPQQSLTLYRKALTPGPGQTPAL